MFLVAELLLLAFAVAVFAPNTPLGKTLHAVLIDAPTKALERATPLKVITGLIVCLILVALMVSAPEWIAIMGIGDLWIYFDIAVVSMLVGSAVRLKYAAIQVIQVSRAIAAGVVARSNRIRGRSRHLHLRRPKLPSSTDEVEPQWDWAIA
jgi:hypothetical protein